MQEITWLKNNCILRKESEYISSMTDSNTHQSEPKLKTIDDIKQAITKLSPEELVQLVKNLEDLVAKKAKESL